MPRISQHPSKPPIGLAILSLSQAYKQTCSGKFLRRDARPQSHRVPRNLKDIAKLLGMAGYQRHTIPRFAAPAELHKARQTALNRIAPKQAGTTGSSKTTTVGSHGLRECVQSKL